MQFTDSHCHLDDFAFSEQLTTLLAQCQQLAINRIIVPSIAPKNFNDVLSLAKRHSDNLNGLLKGKLIKIYPCLGIHPWFLQALDNSHLDQLTELIAKSRNEIIAVGEIGLDGAIAKNAESHGQTPEDNWNHQQHFFDFQLNIAKEQNLPVIVHHRQSHDKIIPFLKKYQLEKTGVIHGFSGSYQQAKTYIDLGYKLGVGSTITYSRAQKTINTIKRLPLSSLVLETDAPSMPLSREVLMEEDEQQTMNSPINLIKVFEVLTKIRAEGASEIASQLEKNIEQLFFS